MGNSPVIVERASNKEKYPRSVFGYKLSKIGEGSFSTVYSTTKGYALKIQHVSKELIDSDGISSASINETSILNIISHINVIKGEYFNLSEDGTEFIMITPLAMKALDFRTTIPDIEVRKNYIYQILRGLAYLHSRYIYHLDIKPENILLFKDGNLKISDFGISIFQPYEKANKKLDVQSLLWRAPEIFAGDRKYNQLVDVWSVGMVLAMFISSKFLNYLYPEDEQEHTAEAVYGKIVKFLAGETENFFNDINEEERNILYAMLTIKENRISAFDALSHSYFDSVRETIESKYPGKVNARICMSTLEEMDNIYFNENDNSEVFDYLLELYEKMNLSYSTVIRAIITYLRLKITDNWKLVILTCVILNSRLEETLLDLNSFIVMSESTYTANQIIEAEVSIMNDFLNFDLIRSDALDYLRNVNITDFRYLKSCIYLMCMPEIYNNYKQKEVAQIVMGLFDIKDSTGCLIAQKVQLSDNKYRRLIM